MSGHGGAVPDTDWLGPAYPAYCHECGRHRMVYRLSATCAECAAGWQASATLRHRAQAAAGEREQ